MKTDQFKAVLDSRSLPALTAVAKSDLHNHGSRGGNIKYISGWAEVEIKSPDKPFAGMAEMQRWFNGNIKSNCRGVAGYLKCLEAAFVQAREDHIHVLAMSFGCPGIESLGGIDNFISIINALHRLYAPDAAFYPELALRREGDPDYMYGRLDEILSKGWFRSIDVCGYEQARPIKSFKQIYRKAGQYGIKLKAHAGEFGSADDVMEAVEELELSEVHHGIAAAKSISVMKWLSDHNIQLNICPTSNIMTGLVPSYPDHPIRALVQNGIQVTINTDDHLIFNQSVSEEFLNLYTHNVLTADELGAAWQAGLNYYL